MARMVRIFDQLICPCSTHLEVHDLPRHREHRLAPETCISPEVKLSPTARESQSPDGSESRRLNSLAHDEHIQWVLDRLMMTQDGGLENDTLSASS